MWLLTSSMNQSNAPATMLGWPLLTLTQELLGKFCGRDSDRNHGFSVFSFWALQLPPRINSKAIVTQFANITMGFRYCTACNKPTIWPLNGFDDWSATEPPMLARSSRPCFAKNRLRFRIKTEFMSRSPTYIWRLFHQEFVESGHKSKAFTHNNAAWKWNGTEINMRWKTYLEQIPQWKPHPASIQLHPIALGLGL